MTGHTPGPWEREAKLQMAEVERLMDINTDLLAALKFFLERHCELVNSGDCGFWNPEDDPEVKQARDAIAKAEGKTDD